MSEIAKYSSLEDKIVIITGGASGIGVSIVEEFLKQGSKVAFLDKEKYFVNNLVNEFNNFKHKPLFKHCDLTNIENLKSIISDCDGLSIRTAKLPSEVIKLGKKLKVISRHGVGYDNIDLKSSKKNNITITITATANAVAVAEHVMFMLLSIS